MTHRVSEGCLEAVFHISAGIGNPVKYLQK